MENRIKHHDHERRVDDEKLRSNKEKEISNCLLVLIGDNGTSREISKMSICDGVEQHLMMKMYEN